MQPRDMIVDTGLSVSILPAYVYEYAFSHIPLRETKIPLVTYSWQRIPVLGILVTQIHHDGNSTRLLLHYEVRSSTAGVGLNQST